MTDLIEHLRSVVRQQYSELRRSLAGLGDLQLTPSFAGRHLITQMRWNSMTDSAKDRAFAKFMADTGIYSQCCQLMQKLCSLVLVSCISIIHSSIGGSTCDTCRLCFSGVATVKTTVTSSDNHLTVVGSPRIARKKSQPRRVRAERTTKKKM